MSIVYVPVKKIYGRTAGLTHTKSQVPPIPFNANDQGLISWSMLGNGQQTGTPSPDNIIMPDFCGVRTAQLFDDDNAEFGKWVNSNGSIQTNATYAAGYDIKVGTASEFSVKYYGDKPYSYSMAFYDSNGDFLSRTHRSNPSASYDTFSVPENAVNARFQVAIDTSLVITSARLKAIKLMLNLGSTALPYEPYGWAEKITCGGQTTPVYLGQVQTVRRIKKIVLTGEEMWQKYTSSLVETARFYLSGLTPGVSYTDTVSSHFQILSGNEDVPHLRLGTDAQSVYSVLYIFAPVSIATTSEQLKSYLAQQYAAGTPVTAWYVLATPQTGIVNEPLCKIGTYADELHSEDTTVTIPTANGANTISVDSTIPPSSLTIQYTSPDYSLITKVYDNQGVEIYSV